MKRLIGILMAAILLLGLSACGNSKELSESGNAAGQETSKTPEVATPQDTTTPMENTENTGSDHSPNILVAYFSRTGTTESLAKYAAEYLNADIFEIEAAVPYSDEDIAYYTDCRADREQNEKSARPEIADSVSNMDQYDTIILGYPIWHGRLRES